MTNQLHWIDATVPNDAAFAPHYCSLEDLTASLAEICNAPSDAGRVELIVRRPQREFREVIEQGELDVAEGLVGDNWRTIGSSMTEDGTAHPEMQLNLMNARSIAAIAGDRARWPLAGDQFFVDFDLSDEILPPGTRLEIGNAVIEVTAVPHTGCKKFSQRFGIDALKFVNSDQGRQLNLRGINAKVISSGRITTGDLIVRI